MKAIATSPLLPAALSILVFVSCEASPRSASLALHLTQGQTWTSRVELRHRLEGSGQGFGDFPRSQPPFTLSMETTWRYCVQSTDRLGGAKVRCELLSARVAESGELGRALLTSLARRPVVLYLDSKGRLAGAERGEPAASTLGPLCGPGSNPPTLAGPIGGLFPGLPERRVALGESWSTGPLGTASPAIGAEGSCSPGLLWTVESISTREVRLAFHGCVAGTAVVPDSPVLRSSVGELSGFLVIERSSGLPLQGKMVLRTVPSGRLPARTTAGKGERLERESSRGQDDPRIETTILFGAIR